MTRGPNPPQRVARRLRPPDGECRPRNPAVLRRGRLPGVHRAAHAGRESLEPRAPRLLPDGYALPRARRRPDRRPLTGHAVDPEPLRPRTQRPVRPKGALFRQRFSSWVIHDEEHFENTVEYILDNPVRAGLVERPKDWPWSTVRPRSEHLFAHDRKAKLACYGSGRTRRSRRPGAQLKDVTVRLPRHKRSSASPGSRAWEVEPCLRHDLRGGPAPLRGVALGLRPPVPPDDGEAGRRLDRRPQPGDLDRPEDHLTKPEIHRRHGHGDLRLPPAALRPRGKTPLSDLRPPDRRPVDRGDRRSDPPAPRGHPLHGQRPRRPRPEGRVQKDLLDELLGATASPG